MTEPQAAANAAALRYSLLNEPLIRYRRVGDGAVERVTLPALFTSMVADRVRDFPALRPHQRHPWHAFLVQLAAIALHQAGRAEPWGTEDEWRHALLALTPDHPDGAAWCLVSPPDRPAFFQAPIEGPGLETWDREARCPDRLDMLITSRNHDLKQARMTNATSEDWLFALVSLQTQEGSNSGSYKGISRMNSGAGSRPGVGVAPNGHIGSRWRSDIEIVLRGRDRIVERYGFPERGGLALTWVASWDGCTQLRFESLDPFYLEICRRVRLVFEEERMVAATFKTPISRIADAAGRNGRTGDPWTPVNLDEGKILTISSQGFGYVLMTQLLLGGDYEPSLAQDLSKWSDGQQLYIVARGVARGNSKTGGYHERLVPVSPKLRRLLLGPQRATVADMAKHRIAAIGEVRKLLWSALVVLFGNGDSDGASDSIKDKAGIFPKPFERAEDARFFTDLTEEVEAEDRDAQRLRWLMGLVERAEAVLRAAFDAGPRSGVQRYKAQAAALSRFHGGLRGPKAALPDLANHYRQQAQLNQEGTDARI